jgi:hypothetical protein
LPDEPDPTVDASAAPRARSPLSAEQVHLPVYRPRHRAAVVFWCAFGIAALGAALAVWLLLA